MKRYTSRNTGHVWTARGHGYYLFCSACGAVAWALLIDGRWRAWAFATVADTARKLPSCRGRVLQEERDRHVDLPF